ncbi:MAG TPA: nitrogen fixation protein NifZ [Aquabacterium sp.]|uniref:nitrogen fixation protein NifZ n=1 Tax=Aquabacterium sp. TaxID=1872578 RepID=UPI002E3093C5|nr:nitrogen fixation protein NifZ [Aquabacterium sp.]HEX5373868.1 nitrogen fixation protein NifZ [Aquabacterium sp.]
MMIEPREPLYDWGQRVVALADMINDGSYPDCPVDAVLVEMGSEGEVVQVGHHQESNQPVYMVDFDGLVVGCLEEEILLVHELAHLAQEARGQAVLPLEQATP